MGGSGVWHVAAARPARFAALAPLSGRYPENGDADRPRGLPVRVYVGDRDERAEGIVAAAIRRGDCFVVTEGAGHTGDYWNRVYSDRTLYRWLLAHRRPASPDAEAIG
jgi:predicted peptidase